MANKQSRTLKMIEMYRQRPNIEKSMALTSFFKTGPGDITNADSVSLDIVRSDEDIAPVLKDISLGANAVSEEVYSNKQFKPPAYAQEMPFNVFDLLKVQPGMTEYQDVNYQTVLRSKVMNSWETLQNMIMRSIELQASQVLQTGKLSLPGKDGNLTYSLDYKPKTAHFPTVTTDWSDSNSTKIADLDSLGDQIRNNGLVDPKTLIFSETSWKEFQADSAIQSLLDNRRINVGAIDPRMTNNGLKYRGIIDIGNYQYEMFTYNARYNPLDGSAKSKYISDDKVIMLPDINDLDFRKVFAGIPVIVDSDPRVSGIMPARVSVPGAFDFKPRVYTDQKAETMFSEIKSRPLLIPTSIDRFGCLTTKQ
jgi:hypothetical protein